VQSERDLSCRLNRRLIARLPAHVEYWRTNDGKRVCT
jgi:hypothetical protein